MSDKTIHKIWKVYLSGEIHTDWRKEIISASEKANLPITFSSAVTNHANSDNCGVTILGAEDSNFWKDHKGAQINAIRTSTLLREADIVVVRFGEKYRQWNAAFEAGLASAFGIPLITLHAPEDTHALKEIDATALAVAETSEQVAQILRYVIEGELSV